MPSDPALTSLRRTAALIAIFALGPALTYITLNHFTGFLLPQVVRDTSMLMVLSVEGLILIFAARTILLASKMEQVYNTVITEGRDLEKDLKKLRRVAKRFKKVVPDVIALLDGVDPEKVRSLLGLLRGEIQKWDPAETKKREEDIALAAERAFKENVKRLHKEE